MVMLIIKYIEVIVVNQGDQDGHSVRRADSLRKQEQRQVINYQFDGFSNTLASCQWGNLTSGQDELLASLLPQVQGHVLQ